MPRPVSFIQWVKETVRGRDHEAAERYMNDQSVDSAPQTIAYVFAYYPEALKYRHILEAIGQLMIDYCTDEEKASELYMYLQDNQPLLLENVLFMNTAAVSVPFLFWEYMNEDMVSLRYNQKAVLFQSLSSTQRKKYAEKALRINGILLRHLSNKQKTLRLCLIAVQNNGESLQYVPPSKKTDTIVKAAIKESVRSLQYANPQQRIHFFEMAVMNPSGLNAWPEDGWKWKWVQDILKQMDPKVASDIKRKWTQQRNDKINMWHAQMQF